MKFSSSILVLVSIVASSLAASISGIKADISIISSHVNALEKSVNEFATNGATLGQAIAIRNGVESLSAALDKSMQDIKSKPHFSEGDGKAIFNSFKGSTPKLVHISSTLVAKKAAVKALPVPGIMGLVRQGLMKLHSSFDAFGSALLASEPNNVKGQVNKSKATVDAAFSKAIAAFT